MEYGVGVGVDESNLICLEGVGVIGKAPDVVIVVRVDNELDWKKI